MKSLRILIPAKGNSRRAPGKNHQLLPYTLNYICRLGLQERTFVMTDCPEIERMAKESNASVLPEYQVGEDFAQNFTQSYLAAGWDSSDLIVLLEPTKPFRQSWLLRECVERYHASGGKIVTTGIQQSLTMITWNQATGRSTRATGLTILDACIVVAQCADFAKIQAMSDFWCDRDVEVVWHEAPTGVDFDYPCDLEYHLPTVGRFSDSRQS